jgi:hypothetical protein
MVFSQTVVSGNFKKTIMKMKRGKFLLSMLSILPLTLLAQINTKLFTKKNPLSTLLEFPLMHAIFGRRSRGLEGVWKFLPGH